MNTYLSTSDLKNQAKERLSGHYGMVIGGAMIINMISGTLSSWMTVLLPSNTLISYLISRAVSLPLSVLWVCFPSD